MDLDWKSIAGAVAPHAPNIGKVLGSAFGPFGGLIGGIAGNAIAGIFGSEATPEAVGKAIAADPEAADKLARLESERGQQILAQAQVEVERLKQATAQVEIAAKDRADARSIFSSLPDTSSHSKLQRRLAYSFVVGFFLILCLMLFRPQAVVASEAFILMLGVMVGAVKDVVSFFFGSSAGSAAKDVTIRTMATEALAAPAPPVVVVPPKTGKK